MKNYNDISLTIAVPMSWELVHRDWMASFFRILKPINTNIYISPEVPLDHNRDNCVKKALEHNSDYLLFWDGDVIAPEDAIIRAFNRNQDIVGGLYFSRKFPFVPMTYKKSKKYAETWEVIEDYKTNDILEVDATGCGFLLIKRTVLEKIEFPYFRFYDHPKTGERSRGEDLYFCDKAKKAGFKIFVDGAIKLGHLQTEVIYEDRWLQSKDSFFAQYGSGENKISENVTVYID